MAVLGGFIHQALALQHAETMLLVHCDEAEALKLNVVFNERVCADNQMGFAIADSLECRSFLRMLQPADKQFHIVIPWPEDAPRGQKMLHRENFSRRH